MLYIASGCFTLVMRNSLLLFVCSGKMCRFECSIIIRKKLQNLCIGNTYFPTILYLELYVRYWLSRYTMENSFEIPNTGAKDSVSSETSECKILILLVQFAYIASVSSNHAYTKSA